MNRSAYEVCRVRFAGGDLVAKDRVEHVRVIDPIHDLGNRKKQNKKHWQTQQNFTKLLSDRKVV